MTGEAGHQQHTNVRDSSPGERPAAADGGMGVSSERVGHAGPGQVGTEGVRDTSVVDPVADADAPPEQRPGLPEPHPDGVPSHELHHRNPGHSGGGGVGGG
ncbi:hypothetical protein [Nocardioides perillae]|uniref:Uncharacterized protein n=1 Tax=Nocardioides perillae TaxID=1119534 RepID=A0A7Y9RX82_9ACTN|nr:hypothetical protein [Nocardioides perillae]NYG56959.1 hypothetical protein [Nocardioides perillae]